MSNKAVLDLDFKPRGKSGKGTLSAKIGGKAVFTSNIDSTDPDARENFLAKVLQKVKNVDQQRAVDAMEEIAANCLGGDDVEQEKLSQAQHVAKQADGAELFHNGDVAYATVNVPDSEGAMHPETYPIMSLAFRRWLESRFYRTFGRPATGGAVQDAISALAGKALYQGTEKKVAVRIAEHGGAIYLDLADETWRVVRITSRGWTVVDDAPIKFLRKKGMLPLPSPVHGGNLNCLRDLVNAGDDSQWVLMVSWLLGSLHPTGPYPALCVNGEQGSAKSTTCKMLRMLIDPNMTVLRSTPRDERDLMIQATNGWICAFDNLSGMRPWLSDALCRISTGGGFGTRALYSDDSEHLFDAKRPIIFNGIEEEATRPDLLERSIVLTLPSIRDERRMTEELVWDEFSQVAPEILGALLDAVSCALKNARSVKLDKLPRMADFAKWVVAAEPALGWKPGTFIDAYMNNREDVNAAALEQSAIGPAIVALMESWTGHWVGTASELLRALEPLTDERTRAGEDWPKTAPKLSAKLRRLAPVLRRNRIDVSAGERTKTRRTLTLSRL